MKEYTFVAWVDPKISAIVSIFAREGSLKKAFLQVSPHGVWGILIPKEDKNIWSGYNRRDIPFYECTFSILGLLFPFNDFRVEVLNHLTISPSQLNLVS